MSFGFGKNSGPTAPPNGQPTFGHFPHPPSPTPSLSPSPFPASNSSARPLFPSPRPQSSFSNGNERATRSYSQQHAAPIRTFDAHVRPRSPPSLGNDHSVTSNSQQHAAIRHGKKNTLSGVSSSQSHKRPFSYSSQDRGTGMSSKLPHLQNMGSSRSPPIQYDDDFLLGSSGDVTKGDHSVHRHDKRNPASGDFGGQSQKRLFPSSSQDLSLRANMCSKHPHRQNMEGSRSPPIQYDDDFLLDTTGVAKQDNADLRSNLYAHVATQRRQSPSSTVANSHSIVNPRPSWSTSPRPAGRNASLQNERSISPTKTADFGKSKELTFNDEVQKSSNFYQGESRRPSLSPPKLRSGTAGVGRPDFRYKQELSPSADEMNDDTSISRPANHSFPKRTRSPASGAGQTIQINAYSTEDDADREEQAKAKRLARFKTELVASEPGDPMRYGQTVTKGKISSMKIDNTSVEKSKFPGEIPSGSMEDPDFDNEDLQSSSVIVGLCIDMCPESEREERERKGDLDQYERVNGDRNQSNSTLAVKKYNRTAEREAELIRPMPILLKTMDYLLGLIDQSYDDRFLGLYNFLWDRMRAIRMDLRMQHIFNERAITMLEQMIRFHIIAMHELCEFSKGEGFSEGFDAHLNIEQMNKTSVELFQLYDDHRKKGIFIPTEKEFRGYYALLKLDKHPGYKVEPAELSLDLAQMTAEIRQTLEVLFARDVARSCRTSNFIAFFRHARNASYLQACLMHAHFSKLRTQALASLHSGLQYNQGLPVAHAAKWLGMEGEDIESLLEYHGFSIKEFEEPYMVKEGPFLNVEKDFPTRRSLLVHRKKSNTIMEDVLSSNQVMLFPQPKPNKGTENGRVKHGQVKPIQIQSIVSDDVPMDTEAVLSPTRSVQDPPIFGMPTRSVQDPPIFGTPTRSMLDPLVLERPSSLQIPADLGTSKGGQSFADNYYKVSAGSPRDRNVSAGSPRDNRASAGSPRENRVSVASPRDNRVSVASPRDNLKPFPSVTSHSLPPSPFTPMHGPLNPDAINTPRTFGVQQFVPAVMSPNYGLGEQDNFEGSSPDAQSEVVHVAEALTPASEARSSIMSSLHDDTSMLEYADSVEQVGNDVDDNFDEEVAEAKLRLLLRLWRRRFLRKKYIREQNRYAANAALSSLNLGPPVWQNRDKTTPCQKLNIDQAMNVRYKKRQMSMVRWNVSDLVASKLAEKNDKSNCICWKVISFSWLEHGRCGMDTRSSLTQMYLDDWLRHKLIPARKEEAEKDLVISASGLSVWRKWAFDNSGDLRCYFSVIKDTQSGNSEKTLLGVDAIIFPISETLSWDIQRAQLNNLVASLPAGVCIPLLIASDSPEENFAEFSCTIIDKLGLDDLDKSRISRFMVMCLSEEGSAQFHGYFSDEKLKEGLMWLASEAHSKPDLFCVTIRELVSHHLNACMDVLDHLGKKVGPSQCISAFNQALDQSINDIITAANTNLAGWPCPELFLMDDSTAEFRLVKQILPTLGWSSSEEVDPLISSLRSSKLPSFSDDLSVLNVACNSEKNIEDKKQLLQDSLIRYLTQSGILLPLMMATKESHLMVQKYTCLELHDTAFKVVPSWVPIFRRVFNWQLNSSANFSFKAYILEQSLITRSSPIINKSDPDVPNPHYISQPSLDEMVEVSCSPIVSKRVRSSPKSFQKVAAIAFDDKTNGITLPDFVAEERNQCSEIQVVADPNIDSRKNVVALVPIDENKGDRLSQLLDQCSILQDEIEKKLSIYF